MGFITVTLLTLHSAYYRDLKSVSRTYREQGRLIIAHHRTFHLTRALVISSSSRSPPGTKREPNNHGFRTVHLFWHNTEYQQPSIHAHLDTLERAQALGEPTLLFHCSIPGFACRGRCLKPPPVSPTSPYHREAPTVTSQPAQGRFLPPWNVYLVQISGRRHLEDWQHSA